MTRDLTPDFEPSPKLKPPDGERVYVTIKCNYEFTYQSIIYWHGAFRRIVVDPFAHTLRSMGVTGIPTIKNLVQAAQTISGPLPYHEVAQYGYRP